MKKIIIIVALAVSFAISPLAAHALKSSITVLSPKAGEVYKIGKGITVTWSRRNIPATAVLRIDLRAATSQGTTGSAQAIGTVFAADKSYHWDIAPTTIQGDYRVEVSQLDVNGNPVTGLSKGISRVFTITNGLPLITGVTITDASGNVTKTLQKGQTYVAHWKAANISSVTTVSMLKLQGQTLTKAAPLVVLSEPQNGVDVTAQFSIPASVEISPLNSYLINIDALGSSGYQVVGITPLAH